ncbi:MAG: glutamate-5-semialdehyde dehydrogenase [Burkholderiales bacterium]|nr:glutamate-5-semialdehyde dehydrogenase [Phycisphaerae bacterium]
MSDPQQYVQTLGKTARQASAALMATTGAQRNAALLAMAGAIRASKSDLIAANATDLEAAEAASLARPVIERLKLNDKRIEQMAAGVESIARQTDPVGQTIEGYVRPDGLRIEKRRVPIGVILFFYESRPNVTSDAAALCLKSGNAIILRGGKEAIHSNRAIAGIIKTSLADAGLPAGCVQIVESTDRALVPLLLKLDKHIDLVIPRGGESLIRAVVADSTIPVLKHFTGNCHIYIDAAFEGIEQQIVDVCVNAKTSYPGGAVCNAVEHLLIHRQAAAKLLIPICEALNSKQVEIRGDETVAESWKATKPATETDWDEEYLAFVIGIKVVDSLAEAIEHINEHGSHHTDGILSTSLRSIEQFVAGVDSASVMVNASTRLADGGEYQLGAEIGISTDKLHARGPMGASDLTTYKWIVTGNGHLR